MRSKKLDPKPSFVRTLSFQLLHWPTCPDLEPISEYGPIADKPQKESQLPNAGSALICGNKKKKVQSLVSIENSDEEVIVSGVNR